MPKKNINSQTLNPARSAPQASLPTPRSGARENPAIEDLGVNGAADAISPFLSGFAITSPVEIFAVSGNTATPPDEDSGAHPDAGPVNPATGARPSLTGGSPAFASRSFFTLKDAAASFSRSLLDEPARRAWVLRSIHPHGPRCPYCACEPSPTEDRVIDSFWAGRRCACKSCGRFYTARTGTFLEGAHLDYRQVFLLAVLVDLMQTGLDAQRVAGIIGISADTVRLWIKRFRAFEGE